MSEFWYYSEGNATRGPITFDQLLSVLSLLPTPRGVLVWREGFDDWTASENVREIAEKLIRPPPLPQSSVSVSNERVPVITETTKETALDDAVAQHQPQFRKDKLADNDKVDQQQFQNRKSELSLDQDTHTRGRIAFIIVAMVVLSAGGYFTNQVYGSSTNGVAYIIGQLLGTWFLLTAITWWWRKSPYTAAVVLAAAALSVGFSNRGKLQEVWDGRVALQAMADPTQLDKTLSKNPENKILRLFAWRTRSRKKQLPRQLNYRTKLSQPGFQRTSILQLRPAMILRRSVAI